MTPPAGAVLFDVEPGSPVVPVVAAQRPLAVLEASPLIPTAPPVGAAAHGVIDPPRLPDAAIGSLASPPRLAVVGASAIGEPLSVTPPLLLTAPASALASRAAVHAPLASAAEPPFTAPAPDVGATAHGLDSTAVSLAADGDVLVTGGAARFVVRPPVGKLRTGATAAAPVPAGARTGSELAALSPLAPQSPLAEAAAPPLMAPAAPDGAPIHGSVAAIESAVSVSAEALPSASALVGALAIGSVAPASDPSGSAALMSFTAASWAEPAGTPTAGTLSALADTPAATPVGSLVVGRVAAASTDAVVGALSAGSTALALPMAFAAGGTADALAPAALTELLACEPPDGFDTLTVVGDDGLGTLGALTFVLTLPPVGGDTGGTCAPTTGATISAIVTATPSGATLNHHAAAICFASSTRCTEGRRCCAVAAHAAGTMRLLAAHVALRRRDELIAASAHVQKLRRVGSFKPVT
jgi:hypothetical protein